LHPHLLRLADFAVVFVYAEGVLCKSLRVLVLAAHLAAVEACGLEALQVHQGA
jgi:anti-sigma factor ChrR (cupin superfamily)